MKISKTSVFHRVLTLTLSNIGLQILGFLYRIFLSRMTGAEGMGVYQLVMPYYSVIMSLTLTGLTVSVSRLCAKYLAQRDIPSTRMLVFRALLLFLIMFVIISVPILLFPGTIASKILGDARTCASLILVLPCLFCTGIENILKNYFFGSGNLRPPITSELTEQSVRFVAVAAFLIAFHPTDAANSSALIISGMIVSEIGSVIILTRAYRKAMPKTARASTPTFREIGSIAVPISLSALANNLLAAINSVLIPQRLIASGMSQSDAMSTFGVLFGMTMPTLMLPVALITALSTVIVPTLSEKLACGNMHELRRKAGKTIHTTSLLAAPAIGVFLPLGSDICRLLYNNPSAGRWMLPLCIATLFTYYQLGLTALLNAIGLQKRAAVIALFGGVIQLCGTWLVGIPQIGLRGFFAGDILSAIVMAYLSLTPIIKHLNLKLRIRNWFVVPALSSILASLCANFIHITAKNDGLGDVTSLIIALVSAVLIYFIALKVQGTSLFTYLAKLYPSDKQRC